MDLTWLMAEIPIVNDAVSRKMDWNAIIFMPYYMVNGANLVEQIATLGQNHDDGVIVEAGSRNWSQLIAGQ